MTPIAAYFIFTANEHERAAAAAHRLPVRPRGPSLVGRLRAFAAGLRPKASLATPA